jgi:hypothetical protein
MRVRHNLSKWLHSKCSPAVECSWNAKYVNLSPLHGLVSHISNQLDMERCYGRYCSILQSSGMGKSRLLDEFSKSFFLIPINLRAEGTTGSCYLITVAPKACLICLIGYPPPDDDVRNFFVRGSPIQAYQVRSFLSALFETTAETLRRLGDDQSTYYTQVARFREFMSKGQHMKSVGSNRRNFYQDVISRVLAVCLKSRSINLCLTRCFRSHPRIRMTENYLISWKTSEAHSRLTVSQKDYPRIGNTPTLASVPRVLQTYM